MGDEILAAANELKTEGRKRKKKKEPDNDHDDDEDDLLLWGYSTLGETKNAPAKPGGRSTGRYRDWQSPPQHLSIPVFGPVTTVAPGGYLRDRKSQEKTAGTVGKVSERRI